jgi:phosphatidylserine decarboxylase
LEKGQEMGRFNMGSTVIVLFPKGAMEWDPGLEAGARVRIGKRLGRLI